MNFVLLKLCLNYRIWLLGSSSYSVSSQNKLSACEHERETLKGEKTELMHLHQQQALDVQHQIEEKVGRSWYEYTSGPCKPMQWYP